VFVRRVRFYEYGGPEVLRVEEADAARAHEIIEARANLGKVVLRP
jgi:hypothetical protein